MKRLQTTMIAGCIAMLTFSACSEKSDIASSNPPEWEMAYMQKAANGNLAEISAGTLATQRADEEAVRAFGEHMVADHSDAQNKLMEIASNLNKMLVPKIDSPHDMHMDILKSLHGRAFDSTYMKIQLMDHQATIDLLQTIQNNSNIEALRNYATQTLPVVQMHYQHADSIATNLFP